MISDTSCALVFISSVYQRVRVRRMFFLLYRVYAVYLISASFILFHRIENFVSMLWEFFLNALRRLFHILWEKDQCIIVVLLITVGYWAILSLNQVYKICKPIIDKQYFNDGLYFVFILFYRIIFLTVLTPSATTESR